MAEPKRRPLRIGELVKETGVARGTIAHYLREGLLPAPEKTSKNMAFYDPECVERIKLIKDLQNKQRLSLAAIRDMLGNSAGDDATARALVAAQEAALQTLGPGEKTPPMTPEAAASAFGVRPETLDELLRLGVVSTCTVEGREVIGGADLEVLAAIANLGELGLNEGLGFTAADLTIYRDHLKALLRQEVETFLRVTTARGDADLAELARSAVDAGSLLIVALRRKLVAALLHDPDEIAEMLQSLGRRSGE